MRISMRRKYTVTYTPALCSPRAAESLPEERPVPRLIFRFMSGRILSWETN